MMDEKDNRFRWSEEQEREVYERCWPSLFDRYNREFLYRFGRDRKIPDEHDFPSMLDAIHYCFFNKQISGGDAWIMTQSIYERVLTNERTTKEWPEDAKELALREYNRLVKDITDSLRIR